MRDPNFIDEQRNADHVDAMADLEAEKQEAMTDYFDSRQEEDDEAMHNTNRSDWWPQDEISVEERNACDLYNERFVISVW